MDIKNLYKQTCNFERKILQLDTTDDSFSDIDVDTLSGKLDDVYERLRQKYRNK